MTRLESRDSNGPGPGRQPVAKITPSHNDGSLWLGPGPLAPNAGKRTFEAAVAGSGLKAR